MSAANYERLLDDFQALWVELGNTLVLLEFAAPKYPPDLSFGRKGAVYEIVGGACLPFRETNDGHFDTNDGRFALAIIKRTTENETQIAEFQTLCAEAGARLPAGIRDVVGDYYWSGNTHPAGWWTALLARHFGIPATNIDNGYLGRPKIHNPLEASIYLIEKLGLNSDSPSWQIAEDWKRPRWNPDTGKLVFQGQVVREYSGQAKNARAVLAAFQEQKWPTRIDDPLPGGKKPDRLNEVVKTLNQKLIAMRFRADGSGSGYRWETAP